MCANGIYFTLYQKNSDTFGSSLIAIICNGGLAGMSSWFFTYPLDIIKTQHQVDLKSTYISLVRKMPDRKAYFKGATPCVVRAFPVNAVQWLTYEKLSKYTAKIKEH